jgi:sigma-B regulation protein RsbU (phosphoserine phosphatase)
MSDTDVGDAMPSESLVAQLLAGLGEAFDLDYYTQSETIEEAIRRQLVELAAEDLPRWGDVGSMTQVAKHGTGLLEFYYRPHLFPDMSAALRLGHQLQFALLPRSLPPRSPLRVAAVLESYCHLSGDLLGWRLEEDALFLWIADISGHGIRAGLAAAVIRLLVDRKRPGIAPDALAREINNAMLAARNPDDEKPLFASAIFMRVGRGGESVYASAGHPPALLRAAAGDVRELPATGCPIGLLPDQSYDQRRFVLGPDETLLLYTDGVTEACDADGEEFGQERLRGLLATTGGAPIDIARRLYDDVTEYKDSASFEDDLTFLVAQRRKVEG